MDLHELHPTHVTSCIEISCNCETLQPTLGGLPSRLSFLEAFSAPALDSSRSLDVYLRTGLSDAGVSETYFSRASQAYFSDALSHLSTKEWCFLMAGLEGSCEPRRDYHPLFASCQENVKDLPTVQIYQVGRMIMLRQQTVLYELLPASLSRFLMIDGGGSIAHI